jgi:hypothetical protein
MAIPFPFALPSRTSCAVGVPEICISGSFGRVASTWNQQVLELSLYRLFRVPPCSPVYLLQPMSGAIERLAFGRKAANRGARKVNGTASAPFEMFGISRRRMLHI